MYNIDIKGIYDINKQNYKTADNMFTITRQNYLLLIYY